MGVVRAVAQVQATHACLAAVLPSLSNLVAKRLPDGLRLIRHLLVERPSGPFLTPLDERGRPRFAGHHRGTIRRVALCAHPAPAPSPAAPACPYIVALPAHPAWPPRNPARRLDGHKTKRRRARLAREQRGRCARSAGRPSGTGELHHLDADPGNDAPSNLVLVHAACNPRGGGLHKR